MPSLRNISRLSLIAFWLWTGVVARGADAQSREFEAAEKLLGTILAYQP